MFHLAYYKIHYYPCWRMKIEVYCLQSLRSSVMLTLQRDSQFQQTRDTTLQRYSAILMLLLKYPGNFHFIAYFLKSLPCLF